MTKKEFWEHLDSLSLNDSTVAHIENKRTIEKITKEIERIIPEKLYRYRTFDFNNYNLSALDKNEIWASSLSEMNDYLEYDPYWSPDTVYETIKDSIASIDSFDFPSLTVDYPGFEETFGETCDLDLLKIKEIKESIIKFNKYILEEIEEVINIMNDAPWILSNQVKKAVDTTYVSCFTEDGCSNIMAGLYSDGAKGFILEYNTKELLFPCIKKEGCNDSWACPTLHHSPLLIPVNYQDERYDISTMLCSIVFQLGAMNLIKKAKGDSSQVSLPPFHLDYLFPLKLAGRKQSVWQHEKEWRLVYFENKEEHKEKKHIPLSIVKPSSIMLCPNCIKENKDKIQSIADSHAIPLYQLIKDYNSREYNALRKELVN